MPYIKTKQVVFVCFFVLIISLVGCSSSERNDKSVIDPNTGRHMKDWLPAAHMKAAKSDSAACSTCHSADFEGGISGVSCTSCHLGGPLSMHPADWTPVYSTHGTYVNSNGTGACSNQYCHGTPLTGVADSGPSCTSCHMGGVTQVHPAWQGQGDACSDHGSYAAANGTAGCANAACHGVNLGGVSQSGPSCTLCHNPIPTGCTSCHGNPPDGDTYPNKAGKHAKHMQLNNVTCATCHSRPCDQHNNGTVNVVFDPAYNAKTGVASFTTSSAGTTCSAISCHGGPRTQTPDQAAQTPPQSMAVQSPDWYTGAINVYDSPRYDYAECAACHVFGTTEFNSFSSGKHLYHAITLGYLCDVCHDFSKLAVTHFTGLNTSVISAGTASSTILNSLQYDGTNCNNHICHSPYVRNWWQ